VFFNTTCVSFGGSDWVRSPETLSLSLSLTHTHTPFIHTLLPHLFGSTLYIDVVETWFGVRGGLLERIKRIPGVWRGEGERERVEKKIERERQSERKIKRDKERQ
jgi:hypothetical protein